MCSAVLGKEFSQYVVDDSSGILQTRFYSPDHIAGYVEFFFFFFCITSFSFFFFVCVVVMRDAGMGNWRHDNQPHAVPWNIPRVSKENARKLLE